MSKYRVEHHVKYKRKQQTLISEPIEQVNNQNPVSGHTGRIPPNNQIRNEGTNMRHHTKFERNQTSRGRDMIQKAPLV